MQPGSRAAQSGYTLVGMLMLVVAVMAGLAVAGPAWSDMACRERERELLKVGVIYAKAIAAYRDASPGTERRGPGELSELLLDDRYVATKRHLRRLYPDPLSAGQPWGVVRDAAGRIAGVHSLSTEKPLAEGPVALEDRVMAPAKRYSDWVFMAEVRQ